VNTIPVEATVTSRTIFTSIALFVALVLGWQFYLWISSPHTAHGTGFYRPYGLVFITVGILLFAFGVFLRWRCA